MTTSIDSVIKDSLRSWVAERSPFDLDDIEVNEYEEDYQVGYTGCCEMCESAIVECEVAIRYTAKGKTYILHHHASLGDLIKKLDREQL